MLFVTSLALAGTLTIDAQSGDESAHLDLEGMVPCEAQEVRFADSNQDVRVKARAASPVKGELYVAIELTWEHGRDGRRVVEVHPSVLFEEGKSAQVQIGSAKDAITVDVDGKGFPVTPGAWCLPEALRSRD